MTNRFYSSTAQPTTLTAAYTDVAATIQVAATTGFPAAPYILAVDYGANQQELVLVTGVAGTTLTVTRGYDNTSPASHSVGAAVRHVHAAIDFRDSRSHENASAGVHGVSGTIVGTTDAQALSNKDLSAGTNTFPASLATDAEVSTAVSNHAALTATHGATGAAVGTTNAQALTNKDLSSGTNTFPASLVTLAGAQTLTNKTLTSPTIDTLAGVTGVGQRQYVTKGADQLVTSSTIFVNDTTLTLPVAANATYVVEHGLRFTCSAAGGVKAQYTIPAGATMATAPATQAAGPFTVVSTASGQTFANSANAAGPTRLITGGSAGSITLQFTQETSDATATTCKAGSFLIVTRIG